MNTELAKDSFRRSASAVLLFAFLTFDLLPPAFADSIRWIYSYDDALKIAAKAKKPVMAFFYTSWCGWCKKLDAETFADGAVVAASGEFVCLRVDGEKDRLTVRRYGVSAYPAILFLDPSGRLIWREYGFKEAAMLAGRMREALSAYRQYAVVQPYLQRAADEAARGNTDKAITIIDDAIKTYKNDARLYAGRGSLKMSKGDTDSALGDFDRALSLNPNDYTVYIMRSVLYFNKREIDKAMDDCNKAISINRWAYEAYNGRGIMYMERGEPALAIKNFNTVLLIKRDFLHAYASRAYAYFMLKEYEKSWGDVREMERRGYKINPDFLEKLKAASAEIK